jgi:hypothetical protein
MMQNSTTYFHYDLSFKKKYYFHYDMQKINIFFFLFLTDQKL